MSINEPLNSLAQRFRDLHQPGRPLLLANVYDGITAGAIASLSCCPALATSLSAIAAAAGLFPAEMEMDSNLRAARIIARIAQQHNKPFSVEFGSGYGEFLEEGVAEIITLGGVGMNLDDSDTETGMLYSIEEGRHVSIAL